MEGGNTVVPSRHYLPSRQGWQDFHCLKLMAVVVVRVEKRNKQRRRCMVVNMLTRARERGSLGQAKSAGKSCPEEFG